MINWYSKKDRNGSATIYSTNITVSKLVSNELLNSFAARIGIDEENKFVVIKPVSKDEYDHLVLEHDEMFILSGGKTYSRISSTDFVSLISKVIDYNFKDGSKKYECYQEDNGNVIIDLNKEIKDA